MKNDALKKLLRLYCLCVLVVVVVLVDIGLSYRNVTLMGLPSGGGSGCYQVYRLRNSQIRIRLSSMASFRPNGKLYDGNGVQPDIVVEPAPTDFIGQTDTVLEAAIGHIKRKNNSLHL